MLNFETNTLVFKFNGEEKRVEFPSVRALANYEKQIRESGDSLDAALDFLMTLGLDEETANKLELAHVQKITEAFKEAKKK